MLAKSPKIDVNYDLLASDNYVINFIRENPEVVNFLLNGAYQASHSVTSSRDVYFPRLEDNEWKTDISKLKDFQDIGFATDIQFLQEKPRLYKLVCFTLHTSQVSLSTHKMFPVNNVGQIKVNYSTYDEAMFRETETSFYLFHGSNNINWYSILRNGLKICSGTQLMTAGAAHGKGIYLSDSMAFSASYCHSNTPCVALFELLGKKEDYATTNKQIYVCKDDKRLRLKHFFLLSSLDSDVMQIISDRVAELKHTPNNQKFIMNEHISWRSNPNSNNMLFQIIDDKLDPEIQLGNIALEYLYTLLTHVANPDIVVEKIFATCLHNTKKEEDGIILTKPIIEEAIQSTPELLPLLSPPVQETARKQHPGITRLMKDYKRFKTRIESGELQNLVTSIECYEDNLDIWRLHMKMDNEFNADKPLVHDMKRKGVDKIVVEIRYPYEYPHKPPFVRIVTPIMKRVSGHITEHGSFCHYMLSNDGWTPMVCIENLLVDLKQNLFEGDGLLADKHWNQEYCYKNSLESFSRALKIYGWH